MARDGAGTYNRAVADYVFDTVISETDVNTEMDDIATALTASIAKDGQTTPTANLPMGTYRHTGVGAASALTDYAQAKQVQNSSFIWCGTAGGTKNALTLTPTPAITAYVTGQEFVFKAGATQSDDAVTIAISGLATKAAQINDAALSATVYIEANKYYRALYDGAALQLTRQARNLIGLLASLVEDTTPQLGGFLDPNGNYIGRAKGGDIASASPLVIDTDGDYFDVTGTTGFSAMTVAAGRSFVLQFDGACTITVGSGITLNNAGSNYTTAAGDHVVCQTTAANTVVGYVIKADGTAVVAGASGALTYVDTVTATAAQYITFQSLATGVQHIFAGENLVPGTDNVSVECELEQGSGTWRTTNEYLDGGGAAQASIALAANVGSAAGEGLHYIEIVLSSPDAGFYKTVAARASVGIRNDGSIGTQGNVGDWIASGILTANTNAVTGLRLRTSSGNWAAGGKVHHWTRALS